LAAALRSKREYDQELIQANWEQVRWQTAVLLAPHSKGGKVMDLQKLLPLPWDPEKRTTKPEDYETVVKKLGRT
jgi:hypothetical protein